MSTTPTAPPSPAGDYKDAKAQAKAAKVYAKAQRPWFKKKRFILPLAFVAIFVMVKASGGGDDTTTTDAAATTVESTTPAADGSSASAPEAEESTAPAEKKAPKAVVVTAKKILKEFSDNEAAADAKYEGKTIAVTGIVDKVDTEFINDEEYVVQIGDGSDFVLFTVNCDDQSNKVAAKVKVGSEVTATGDFEDGGDLGVEMHGCVLS